MCRCENTQLIINIYTYLIYVQKIVLTLESELALQTLHRFEQMQSSVGTAQRDGSPEEFHPIEDEGLIFLGQLLAVPPMD